MWTQKILSDNTQNRNEKHNKAWNISDALIFNQRHPFLASIEVSKINSAAIVRDKLEERKRILSPSVGLNCYS